MPRTAKTVTDPTLLTAALEGLELQKARIDEQIRLVRSMLGRGTPRPAVEAPVVVEKPRKKRELSESARKRIALAQKRRWAAYRKQAKAKGKGAAEAVSAS